MNDANIKIDLADFQKIIPDQEYRKIRTKRIALGLTQEEVANQAGIRLRLYQDYEDGTKRFSRASFQTGIQICRVLRLDPMKL